MKKLSLNKSKPAVKRLKLSQGKEQKTDNKLSPFLKQYEMVKEKLKKEKPASFHEWIKSEKRMPDDSENMVNIFNPLTNVIEIVPSAVALQKILYMKMTYNTKGFQWMKIRNPKEN